MGVGVLVGVATGGADGGGEVGASVGPAVGERDEGVALGAGWAISVGVGELGDTVKGAAEVGLSCVGVQPVSEVTKSAIQTRLVRRGFMEKVLYRWLDLRVR